MSTGGRAVRVATAGLGLAVAAVFVVQFALSGWAEGSSLHHDLQHGLLFLCGIAVGVAGTVLVRAGSRTVPAAGTPSAPGGPDKSGGEARSR